MTGSSWRRLMSMAYKESLHIARDPQTLFFTLFVPILQLCLLGYAVDTNVRFVPTVVVDLAGTQESRALVQRFENSQDFRVVVHAASEQQANQCLVAGKAQVGLVIPADYSRKLEAGETAQVLILVDGSMSSIAAEAVNVGNALALSESLQRALPDKPLPVETRPQVLFNPDTRSANFFIPGLIVILCQMMATMLSANAIVREKEMGTLEQLFMTPVRRGEMIIGKMLPYAVLTVLEFCLIAAFMRYIFQVPLHGWFVTLLALAVPFVLTMLGAGLLISTRASTLAAAGQMAMGTILPSIFLSGYVFPLESMPTVFLFLSNFLPATWLIDASRGVILRGAGWHELWFHAVVLWAMAVAVLTVASLRMRKQLV
jgi:ABC-2 type transport system permease protein